MRYYDLHLESNFSIGRNSPAELAGFAASLGYAGIAICDSFRSVERLKELKEACRLAEQESKIEVVPGVKIEPGTKNEMKQLLGKVREHAVIVIVSGGEYLINRAACEDPRVDILAHPELGRIDNGLDEYCMNQAMDNDVAIQISFRSILYSYRKSRSHIMNHMATNVRLSDALKTKMIICSGAQSIWDMRDPRELISIANMLGMDINKSFMVLSDIPQQIIAKNRKKLAGESPTKGVEVIG